MLVRLAPRLVGPLTAAALCLALALGSSTCGSVVGMPCQQESDCQGEGDCGFLIAQGCSATGVCIAKPDPDLLEPDCIFELCGCDGRSVDAPCYWSGDGAYAAGPANPDPTACSSIADAGALLDASADAAD
jgi:hypothetical protein